MNGSILLIYLATCGIMLGAYLVFFFAKGLLHHLNITVPSQISLFVAKGLLIASLLLPVALHAIPGERLPMTQVKVFHPASEVPDGMQEELRRDKDRKQTTESSLPKDPDQESLFDRFLV